VTESSEAIFKKIIKIMKSLYTPKYNYLIYLLLVVLSSCTSSRIINTEFNYFQKGLDSAQEIKFTALTIKPNDLLNIQISSNTLNQDQVALFNAANFGGSTGANGGAFNQQQFGGANTFGFLVDEEGYIKYPMLGKVQAAGMTRDALAHKLETELAKKEIVKEPNIQVRFLQLKVNVMGEVKAPGTKSFSADRITILDAIAAAGDLSDRGRRDKITVIREEAGQKKSYQVNLLNTDFINSPVFQLQQNDLVYVNANNIKLKETNFDPQVQRDLQIGLSVASGLSFLINLFLLFKN
jgi:polysaccharide export outer membrane protein